MILQGIKGYTSREINKILNKKGSFWQDESFDRLIRDDKELFNTIKYVLQNPVSAGLVDDWENWEHSYCHPSYLVM